MSKSDPGQPFFLRFFPDELRRELEAVAKESDRSLSAEIRHRLRLSFNRGSGEATA